MKKMISFMMFACVMMLVVSAGSQDYNPFDDKAMKEIGRTTHESNIVSRALLKLSDLADRNKNITPDQRTMIETEKKVFKDTGPRPYPNVKFDDRTLAQRAFDNSPEGKEINAMVDKLLGIAKEEKKTEDTAYRREQEKLAASKDPKDLEELKNNPFISQDLRVKADKGLEGIAREAFLKLPPRESNGCWAPPLGKYVCTYSTNVYVPTGAVAVIYDNGYFSIDGVSYPDQPCTCSPIEGGYEYKSGSYLIKWKYLYETDYMPQSPRRPRSFFR